VVALSRTVCEGSTSTKNSLPSMVLHLSFIGPARPPHGSEEESAQHRGVELLDAVVR
jgi:hypothetical protein